MYQVADILSTLNNDGERTSDALAQLKVYAHHHGHQELELWLTCELEGYPSGVNVPSYRQASVTDWKYGSSYLPGMPSSTSIPLSVPDLEKHWSEGVRLIIDDEGAHKTTCMLPEASISSILQAVRLRAKVELGKVNPPAATVKSHPVPDFRAAISDQQLAEELEKRWEEANTTHRVGAHLSTVILLGSIVEGVLLYRLQEDFNVTTPVAKVHPSAPKQHGVVPPPEKWKFVEMVRVAEAVKWFKEPFRFSDGLREYRNLVHPNVQLQMGVEVDEQLANICWAVCDRGVRQLLQ